MSDRFFVATRKGLFRFDRSGNGWKISNRSFLGDPVYIVFPDSRTNTVYAAITHGHFGTKVHRSGDGGETWEECGVPTYPEPGPDDEIVKCPMRGTPIPWNLELIWALEGGGADQPDTLWCGTVPGGLFRSTDRGASWKLVESLWRDPGRAKWFGGGLDHPGIHSICVDPRNSKRVQVGVSCGGVWTTEDAGETWACTAEGMRAAYMPPDQSNEPGIQDPHCMVQCPSSPDVLWVQHHNGVFRSVDGAKSWTEIENVVPSTFGFAVAVHPDDGDTAWTVPAIKDELRIPVDGKVVVARTHDGGKTWDALRSGLPQADAYDLTFRHALDVDSTGKRLAFGSTTGSVWATDDGGDSWRSAAANLPPVYCVRFG